jgi:hypothetical protein
MTMDDLTEEQRIILDNVRKVVKERIAPNTSASCLWGA